MGEPEPTPRRSISLGDPDAPSPLFDPRVQQEASPVEPPAPVPAPAPQASPPPLPEVSFEGSPEPPSPPRPSPTGRPDFLARQVPPARLRLRDRIWLPNPLHLLLVVLVVGAWWCWSRWDRPLEPTGEHRAMVLSAERLAEFTRGEAWTAELPGGFTVRPSGEELSVRRRLWGTVHVDYRYATGDGDQPEIEAHLSLHTTEDLARAAYDPEVVDRQVDRSDVGGEISDVLHLRGFQCGDESRGVLLLVDGEPVGHRVVMRVGRAVLLLTLRGVHFEDQRDLRALLEPVRSALLPAG